MRNGESWLKTGVLRGKEGRQGLSEGSKSTLESTVNTGCKGSRERGTFTGIISQKKAAVVKGDSNRNGQRMGNVKRKGSIAKRLFPKGRAGEGVCPEVKSRRREYGRVRRVCWPRDTQR